MAVEDLAVGLLSLIMFPCGFLWPAAGIIIGKELESWYKSTSAKHVSSACVLKSTPCVVTYIFSLASRLKDW